jgi:NADPH-dependent curcumin reductase CurA
VTVTIMNRQWLLAARPKGAVRESDFQLVERPLPPLEPGQFLIRTLFLGVAAVMRGYMLNTEKFERPLEIGDLMHGRGVGEVLATRNPDFAVGDIVHGKLGWREYAIADGSPYYLMYKVHQRVAPVSTALGVLGLTGFTSYLGLVDIGKVRAGDTVLVSGAAGGVGSNVGQIARNLGARAVGLAGSDEKCRLLTEKLGYAVAINYRTEPLDARLRDCCPDGIDVVFDNVGGEILDTACCICDVMQGWCCAARFPSTSTASNIHARCTTACRSSRKWPGWKRSSSTRWQRTSNARNASLPPGSPRGG